MYSHPPGNAARFEFRLNQYDPPSAASIHFDFTAHELGVAYPPIPGVIRSVGAPWRPAPEVKERLVVSPFQASSHADITRALNAGQASTLLEPRLVVRFEAAEQFTQNHGIAWDDSRPKERAIAARHENGTPRDIDAIGARWETASRHHHTALRAPFLVKTPWKDRKIDALHRSADLYAALWRRVDHIPLPLATLYAPRATLAFRDRWRPEEADLYVLAPEFPVSPTQPKDIRMRGPFGDGAQANINKGVPWGPSGARDTTLDFEYDDYPGPIDFPDAVTIPTLRFYVVANSINIVRVSDGEPIPAMRAVMSINSDQFLWSFNAVLPSRELLPLVTGSDGQPVEVDITINGVTWRVLVDGWNARSEARDSEATITGRSLTAYLAQPYAAPRDYTEASALLAQQLAAQELPPGWTLEWNATDWIVAPGAWQYQGLAPVEAIARVAEAAGAYVQSHPSQQKIIVNPLYPASPWELDTLGPDFQIPKAVMAQQSSQKLPGKSANGVYVFGGAVGPYHADVVRRQTNGEPRARQVVNPLVTDRNPAEALGRVALGATGRRSLESHLMPFSPSLGGLVDVGSMVEVGTDFSGTFAPEWIGIVRGVTISAVATLGARGSALDVGQTLEILRHFDEDLS